MKVQAEPEGTPNWRLPMNRTSCGRFSVKGRAEQGNSTVPPCRVPFSGNAAQYRIVIADSSCFIIPPHPSSSSPSPATATAGNSSGPLLSIPAALHLFTLLAVSSSVPSPEHCPMFRVCFPHHEPSRKQANEKLKAEQVIFRLRIKHPTHKARPFPAGLALALSLLPDISLL